MAEGLDQLEEWNLTGGDIAALQAGCVDGK